MMCKYRRVGLILDAVFRGVLCTLSAWVILDSHRCGSG